MFTPGEKVVYPGQGVAQVKRIVENIFGQAKITYYELIFLSKNATLLVPLDKAELVGLRSLSSKDGLACILEELSTPAKRINIEEFLSVTWNRRCKKYQAKILTGNIGALIEIYKDLYFIALHKDLSFGERNVLQQVEGLLVEEISLVRQINPSIARSLLQKNATKGVKKIYKEEQQACTSKNA